MARAPTEEPGATMEPAEIASVPETVPLPARVWPAAKVRVPSERPLASRVAPAATVSVGELGIEPPPFRVSVPALIRVTPVEVLVPARYKGLAPTLSRLPGP